MKKVLSVILATLMALTCFSTGTAFAAEAKAAKVTVCVQKDGAFKLTPVELNVSADLSDKYSEAIGYNDEAAEPTILDVAVAAELELFGEDFTTEAPLTIGENGFITDFMGWGGNLFYYVNAASASAITQSVKDSDYVLFGLIRDTTGWSDTYIDAKAQTETALINKPFEITLNKVSWSGTEPAEGLAVTVDGKAAGKTDKNGKASITFDKYGSHIVSTESTLGKTPVFMPYVEIDVTSELINYIDEQEQGAADYIFGKTKNFALDSVYDYLMLVRSGYDVSAFKKGFAKSVKANLAANEGKIVIEKKDSEGKEIKSEDLGVYGAVILALNETGYNAADFEGYNIVEAFDNAEINDNTKPHQYYYKYAIEAAKADKAKAIANDLIENYYTLGKGMENWGYSCDNACQFLVDIAPYASDFKKYVDDAKAVIKTYLLEKGAFCDEVWSNKENADSTALSMAAFASVGDIETAFNYYKLLVENFEGKKTGVFTLEGVDNSYATKDALYSLYYMKKAVLENYFDSDEHILKFVSSTASTCSKAGYEVYNCAICKKEIKKEFALIAHTPKAVAAVPATFKAKGKTAGTRCSVCGAVITPQKDIPMLSATKFTKIKKGKKSIVAKWKAVKGVDGYQIQYSTKKKFKKKKTVTIKNAKAAKKKIKKLKANKTYYVRIRAYKVINGKKQFSKWSKIKKVKIK